MAMFPPVFALGKGATKTIASMPTSTSYTLDSVSGLALGNHVFTSESDWSVVEYVGKITNIATLTVTVNYAGTTRHSGDKLWIPSSSWQASSVVSLADWGPRYDPGMEALEVGAPEPLLSQVRDARETLVFGFQGTTAADWQAWRTWLTTYASGGMAQMTAGWADRDTGTVRAGIVKLLDPPGATTAKSPVYGLRNFEISVALADEGAYV